MIIKAKHFANRSYTNIFSSYIQPIASTRTFVPNNQIYLVCFMCIVLLFHKCTFFSNTVSSSTTLFRPFQNVSFPSPPSASYPVCDVGDNVSRFLPSPWRILGGRTRANTNTNRLLSCRQWGKCRQMSGSRWKLLSGLSFCIYFRGEIIDDWRPAHNAF